MELLEANDRFYCKHLTCPSLASPICINYTLKPQKRPKNGQIFLTNVKYAYNLHKGFCCMK